MKTIKGIYHTLVLPGDSGFASFEVALAGGGVYRADGENSSLTFEAGSIRRISSPILLPSFLYHIEQLEETPDENKGERFAKQELLPYPPTAAYERRGGAISVTPLEDGLSRNISLDFRAGDYLQSFEGGFRGVGLQMPREFALSILRGGPAGQIIEERGSIVLKQPQGEYLLERWPKRGSKGGSSGQLNEAVPESRTISDQRAISYLSVKDILEPQSGLEGLIEALKGSRLGVESLSGRRREKMGRLLDIIRSAQPQEEETILSNMYRDDPELFSEIDQRLFHDFLLDFMDPKEVSRILMEAPDEVLRPIVEMAPEKRERYRKLISKNRYSFLEKGAPKGGSAGFAQDVGGPGLPQKGAPWVWIENAFRKKKLRSILMPGEAATFYLLSEGAPEAAIQELKGDLGAAYRPQWIGAPGVVSELFAGGGKLSFLVERPLARLTISVEVDRGLFFFRTFRDLMAGRLEMSLPRAPRGRVVWGGVTYEALRLFGGKGGEEAKAQIDEGFCYRVFAKSGRG